MQIIGPIDTYFLNFTRYAACVKKIMVEMKCKVNEVIKEKADSLNLISETIAAKCKKKV